jgi:predicted nucleic acid-binding protein
VVLVDTSVWIEVFRKPSSLSIEAIVDLEEVVTCLPIVQEVLQGFQDERAYAIARDAMRALPVVESPLGERVFDEAVDLFRRARRAGVTVRSGVDCLIAACALRHDLAPRGAPSRSRLRRTGQGGGAAGANAVTARAASPGAQKPGCARDSRSTTSSGAAVISPGTGAGSKTTRTLRSCRVKSAQACTE